MGPANREIPSGNTLGCSVSETLEDIWEEFQSNGSESLPTPSNSISSAFRKPPVSFQSPSANLVLPNSSMLSMDLLNSILKTLGIENPSEQDKTLLYRMLIRMKQQSLVQNIMQTKVNTAGGNILNNFNISNLSNLMQSNVVDQQTLQEMMYYQQLLASANPDLLSLNSPAAKFAMINSQILQGQFRRRRVPSVVGGCAFCRNNGEQPNVFKSHVLRDSTNKVRCPVLRAYTCPNCSATGDSAHTIKYCPHLLQDGN